MSGWIGWRIETAELADTGDGIDVTVDSPSVAVVGYRSLRRIGSIADQGVGLIGFCRRGLLGR